MSHGRVSVFFPLWESEAWLGQGKRKHFIDTELNTRARKNQKQ